MSADPIFPFSRYPVSDPRIALFPIGEVDRALALCKLAHPAYSRFFGDTSGLVPVDSMTLHSTASGRLR